MLEEFALHAAGSRRDRKEAEFREKKMGLPVNGERHL
jgi:hypothetical protein